jgi:hypothetical protein
LRPAVVLALLLAVFVAVPASAGTYDVVACGTSGINRSWTSEVVAFPPVEPVPSAFEFRLGCAPGLSVTTHPERRKVGYSNTGSLKFSAPAGTAIVAVRASRYGEVRSSPDDPNTPDPENGDWEVGLGTNVGRVGGDFGSEQCRSEATGVCVVGAAGRTDTGLIRVAPASSLSWSVGCGGANLASCFTASGPPLGTLTLYGVTVTLEDTSAPTADLTGELLADGWRRPSNSLLWSARDNVGIRSGQILVDGQQRQRVESSCDATRPVPCPNVTGAAADLGSLADGRHEISLIATDSAGNAVTTTRSVAVDGTPPSATLSRASGRTISVRVADGASGLATGAIEVRNRPSEPFRAVPTTLANGVLTARLDRGSAARAGIRVTVTDNAGNVTAGHLNEMSLRVGGRSLRGGAASLGYGRSASVTGRLSTRDGQVIAGVPVTVESTPRGGSPSVVATVTTSSRGGFTYRAPAGVSRTLKFTFAGGSDLAPLTRSASLRVRASSTISASRTVLNGRGRVRFSGRLGLRGAMVPRSGKIVELQAYDGGRWRIFATARARGSKGRWSASYTFGGTPGRYPVRLRIRREAVFPYDLGYSRSVVIRIR